MRCHGKPDSDAFQAPQLTGETVGSFTRSYESLRPFVRWYEWGGKSIAQTVTRPGHCGADESPLLKVLQDANHKPHLKIPQADMRRLTIWLDANVPFYGTNRQDAERRQLAGDAVPPPKLQ